MGLTHAAQLNLITDFGIRWTIVEPSFAVRAGLRYFLPGAMLEEATGSLAGLKGNFDLAVVTSPTMHHDAAWAALKGRAAKFLIEKPLNVRNPGPEVLCGYVLLHHPLQRDLSALAAADTVAAVNLKLRANTVLGPNTGWRGLKSGGGGVLNEFGSHLLSLLVDLAGPIDHIAVSSSETVYSVDVPDRAELSGKARRGAAFTLSLDWTCPDIRKPAYDVEVVFADGRAVSHDLYEMRSGGLAQSIAERETASGVYLRGFEFTEQARFLLENDRFDRHLGIAVEVDRLLGELA
jgi:predicted dehydrogenase